MILVQLNLNAGRDNRGSKWQAGHCQDILDLFFRIWNCLFLCLFPAPMQCLYYYQSRQLRCTYLVKISVFTEFRKSPTVNYKSLIAKEVPTQINILISFPSWSVSPVCLLPFLWEQIIKNSWVHFTVLYQSKDFLTRNSASAISVCMLSSCNKLTYGFTPKVSHSDEPQSCHHIGNSAFSSREYNVVMVKIHL